MKLSHLAEHIVGSEIIKLAAQVNERVKAGEKIVNLTIGDFDPHEFPIPAQLKQGIIDAYHADQTNYPPADGVLELRTAVSNLLSKRSGLQYSPDEVLIAGGARPIIYSIFRTLVDPDDTVVFAVPSWNNNHYTFLNGAKAAIIEARAESNFMPTAADIEPYIQEATLIALCSPQNPTGTVFSLEGLSEICQLILSENQRRGVDRKPVFLMYDQIYWELTLNGVTHVNPVTLHPEMRPYTVFVDGISKSLSATGIRVGWSMGPKHIIDKMKAILTHIGAWAPKAEQVATASFLADERSYEAFLNEQRAKISVRLRGLYDGLITLKNENLGVDVVTPQAAIYLTVQFRLIGKKTASGKLLQNTSDITQYMLDEAKIAIVPFYAFGASHDSTWYRFSIGTCGVDDIPTILSNLRQALQKLT